MEHLASDYGLAETPDKSGDYFDFSVVVTDKDGVSYALNFEKKPEGLADVSVGDSVTVTYTGELSEIDPFTGTILRVEPAK